MDKKHATALSWLDLSKAFDSVNYTISLHKLRSVGASPQAVKWFESYLSVRSQYVQIRSTVSSFGSLLVSGIDSLTISIRNDLPSVAVRSDLDTYVDDSELHLVLSRKRKPNFDLTRTDLYRTAKWCLEDQLVINRYLVKACWLGLSLFVLMITQPMQVILKSMKI